MLLYPATCVFGRWHNLRAGYQRSQLTSFNLFLYFFILWMLRKEVFKESEFVPYWILHAIMYIP